MNKVLPTGYASYATAHGQRAAQILADINALAKQREELKLDPQNEVRDALLELNQGLIDTGKKLLELHGAPSGGLVQYIPKREPKPPNETLEKLLAFSRTPFNLNLYLDQTAIKKK